MSQNTATDRPKAALSAKTAPLSGRARTIGLIVASAFFMQLLDSTIITTSLPQIAADFGVEPAALGIGVTIYMLAMAVVMPVSGWLADRFGDRTIFLVAIAIFVAASLWVGASSSLAEFVLARAAQGVGGAFMTPVGRTLVLRSVEKNQLLPAIAIITWPALFAPVIGPVIGGFITTYFSWRWNFFINIPLGLIGMALVYAFIPNTRETRRHPLDLKGFFLTAAASGLLLYGLESVAHGVGTPALSLTLVLAGLILGFAAVRHLRSAKTPLVDLSSFAHQTFRFSNISAGFFQRCAIAATPFLLPLYFQLVFGMSPLEAGGYLLVYFLGNLAMKTVTTPIVRGLGFRTVLIGNGFLATVFLSSFILIGPQTPELVILLALFGAGLTRSMQFTALNTIGFADIAPEQRASASTLSSILQQASMVVGVAIAASILSLAPRVRSGAVSDAGDFQLAFAVVGLIALAGTLRFLLLAPTAGDEVAGRAA